MNALVAAAGVLLAVVAVPYLGFIALYLVVRPHGSPADKQAAEPTVSVVLPTYNEAAIIERKLDDICAQDYPLDRIELVVVDASDDDTAAIVASYFEDRDAPELVLLEEPERRGVATALNRAFEAASGEVVFRTDSDSSLDPGAIREAVANLADPGVGAVTGRQTAVLGDSQVEADYRNLLAHLQLIESHLDSTFVCHGPCLAIERADFVALEADSLADDTELGMNVRMRGKRVVMDPAMQFAESGTSSFAGRRRRKDRRATGLVQLLVRRRKALGRYGRYGRVILPFNWWFMVVSPWLLLLGGLLAFAGAVALFGVWALLVPAGIVGFVWLGQRDGLGPVQPAYALFDAQVSLLVAAVRLATGGADGTWAIDRASREAFE